VLARITVFAAAALIGAAVDASAAEPEMICGVSTVEMVACFNAETAQWDKRLNAAYQTAVKDAEPKQREQLRKAERLWVQYRDANCTYYFLGEGSIARVEAAQCMYRMTKQRAQELKSGGGGPDNPGKEDRD
jgi:uncharacterized protein YecT (DUF1311 family)